MKILFSTYNKTFIVQDTQTCDCFHDYFFPNRPLLSISRLSWLFMLRASFFVALTPRLSRRCFFLSPLLVASLVWGLIKCFRPVGRVAVPQPVKLFVTLFMNVNYSMRIHATAVTKELCPLFTPLLITATHTWPFRRRLEKLMVTFVGPFVHLFAIIHGSPIQLITVTFTKLRKMSLYCEFDLQHPSCFDVSKLKCNLWTNAELMQRERTCNHTSSVLCFYPLPLNFPALSNKSLPMRKSRNEKQPTHYHTCNEKSEENVSEFANPLF